MEATEPLEPVAPPKSRGKRALELLPVLLAHIEYMSLVTVKNTDFAPEDCYRKGMAILEEK